MDVIDKTVQLGDKKFGKLEFLAAFQSFCNQIFKPITIYHTFKSTRLVPFNSDVVLEKIREKQAQKAQTAIRTPFLLPLPLHQCTPQGPVLVVIYRQKLQRAYSKLKPREIVDSVQIQWFIHKLIASAHTLKLMARDLTAIQETIIARAKQASLGEQVAQKGGTIKVSECHILCSKRKEKEEEQAQKKRERRKVDRKASEFSAGSN